MADSPLAKEIVGQWDRMDSDAATFKIGWQDIANYMNPDRNDYIVERTPGMKRMQFVFDSSPILALEEAAAGLHSRLTSAWLQWFHLRVEDDRIDSIDRVRAWLEAASGDLYALFAGPRYSFAAASHELYRDVLMIGTSAMAVLESQRSGVLFSTRHMKECRIAENEEDRVDTLIRSWTFTAKQAVEAWGDAAGEKVVKAAGDPKSAMAKFRFLHAVRPRRVRDAQRSDKLHKAWESVYVSLEDMCEIDVSGFDEFPYLVPRFSKIAGETYGRGPGWVALPDVKMLNEMVKLVLKAAEKVVDPPLQLPDSSFMVPIKTSPASLNYYRANSTGRIEPIKTGGDVPIGIEMINSLRQQVRAIFHHALLRMAGADNPDPTDSPGKGVTAAYVSQDTQDRGMMQSPMLARMQSEFTGPLIDRAFAIRWRQSVRAGFGPGSPFPPPPPELSGARLKVEYVSPISLAQKASEIDAIDAVIQTAQRLGQADPTGQTAKDMAKVINAEGILRLVARDRNAPVVTLRSAEDVAQARQAEAEAEQAMAQHQQAESVAKTAKDGSVAAKNIATLRGGGGQQQQEAA